MTNLRRARRSPRARRAGRALSSAKNKRAASSHVVAREDHSETVGEKGVGGPHKSDEDGKRLASEAIGAKAARAEESFGRDPCPVH